MGGMRKKARIAAGPDSRELATPTKAPLRQQRGLRRSGGGGNREESSHEYGADRREAPRSDVLVPLWRIPPPPPPRRTS